MVLCFHWNVHIWKEYTRLKTFMAAESLNTHLVVSFRFLSRIWKVEGLISLSMTGWMLKKVSLRNQNWPSPPMVSTTSPWNQLLSHNPWVWVRFFSFYLIFFCYQSRYIFFICKRTVKFWHVITDVLNKLTLIAVFFLSITKMTAPSLANMVELV